MLPCNDMSHTHTHLNRVTIETHAALGDVGGEVLLQDAPLSLRSLQLHILLVKHRLQVSHFALEPGDLLLHLNPQKLVISLRLNSTKTKMSKSKSNNISVAIIDLAFSNSTRIPLELCKACQSELPEDIC